MLTFSAFLEAAFGQEPTGPVSDPEAPAKKPEVRDDTQDLELLELEVPMVVTAARREEKITGVPYAISIITTEDIRRSGARTIPDALRLVPGLDVADLSFGNYAVSPRGLQGLLSRELLVLVDGRQIFDAAFGGTTWGAWPFQLEDIAQIEVIRGPGGVTWGANAVNGVINIITKDPGDQLGLTLTLSGGSRGTFKKHVGYGWQEGKLRLRLSGEYEASDGFREGGSSWRNLDDDYKSGRIGVHAVYQANASDTLTFSTGSAVLDGGYPPTPLLSFRTTNSGTQANFMLGTWTRQIAADNQLGITAYVNDFHLSAGIPALDYRYQQLALQLTHSYKPAEAHRLTWGVDTRVDLVDGGNADPLMFSKDFVSSVMVGAHLQDEWRFAPKWALSLGGRVDYESYGGFQPSARAALIRKLSDDALVYGAVSRAFQMPPAAVRFVETPFLGGLAALTGEREIDPEVLTAYELGYRGRPLDRLDVNFNVFWHEYDPLAVLKVLPGPPGLIRVELDNGYRASLYGAEFDGKYAVTPKLTLLGHYTWQFMAKRGLKWPVYYEYLSPPKHKFMLGARYSATEDLHLSGQLHYVDAVTGPDPGNPLSPRHIDPYFRLDLRAEYEFARDRAAIAVGARNLLDSGHYEGGSMFINDAQVPRMFYAELRMEIK